MLKTIREYLTLAFAALIIAASVFFFLIPSNASVSSISGLSIVLKNFVPFSVAWITMVLNVSLLAVAFLFCGGEFGAKTVFTSILHPIFLTIFEKLFPDFTSLTGSDLLDVVCYVFTVSIGLAILFNRNASSGGLDIVAKLMNKYLHMDIGRAMSAAGMVIACSSALAYPPRTLVLSLLGTYLNGIVLDHYIFDQNIKRRVCIVSLQHCEEIRLFILNTLHSGATLYDAVGAYSFDRHQEIITIVDRQEYQKLMDFIVRTDPSAFVTVYNVNHMRYLPKK